MRLSRFVFGKTSNLLLLLPILLVVFLASCVAGGSSTTFLARLGMSKPLVCL